jgi:hypothetical protein
LLLLSSRREPGYAIPARTLELTSALYEYPRKGRYKIAVKVIIEGV